MTNKYGIDKKDYGELAMVGYALRGVLSEVPEDERNKVMDLVDRLHDVTGEADIGEMTMISVFIYLADLIKED